MDIEKWTSIYLLLIGLVGLVFNFRRYITNINFKSTLIVLTIVLFIAKHISTLIDSSFVIWLDIIIVLSILSIELEYIRQLKPKYQRFPFAYNLLPYISIFFFPLIINSNFLVHMVLDLYQAIAIMVALILFVVGLTTNNTNKHHVISALIIAISYFLHFIDIDIEWLNLSALVFGIGLAMLLISNPFLVLEGSKLTSD